MRYKVWYESTWTGLKDTDEVEDVTLNYIEQKYNNGHYVIRKIKRMPDKTERSDYEQGCREGFLMGIPVTILCSVLTTCAISLEGFIIYL